MSATGNRAVREAGQTLIEMLVALAILGLVAGIAAPVMGGLFARRHLTEACGTIALGVAQARSAAIAGSATVRLDLVAGTGPDDPARLVLLPGQRDLALPAAVALDWPPRGLEFHADGSAGAWDGAIHAGALVRAFHVDPVHARAEFGA